MLHGLHTKLGATCALVCSSYHGGSDVDEGLGIAVDVAGNAYVTGSTGSTDFPTTAGAVRTTNSGFVDAFVAKLDPTGSLLYSPYLRGTDFGGGFGIAVDAAGHAHLAGSPSSPNFP